MTTRVSCIQPGNIVVFSPIDEGRSGGVLAIHQADRNQPFRWEDAGGGSELWHHASLIRSKEDFFSFCLILAKTSGLSIQPGEDTREGKWTCLIVALPSR